MRKRAITEGTLRKSQDTAGGRRLSETVREDDEGRSNGERTITEEEDTRKEE